jgi:hypothetical protein
MNSKDPLERAFELLKADSTGLAFNSDLEDKLMTELQRRNRPNRLRRAALIGALLLGVILAGGGAALAGVRAFQVFVLQGDGKTWVLQPGK